MARVSRHYDIIDSDTVAKIYLTQQQYSFFIEGQHDQAESDCVLLSAEINEWLTLNCSFNWRVFTENSENLILFFMTGTKLVLPHDNRVFAERLKPYIGFQSQREALLFKLAC
jgi:hypothetical protein